MKADIGQWEFVDKTLRTIADWLEERTGFEFTMTSTFRIDDKGVHGTLPLRGIDLRCREASLGKNIEALINGEWEYDPRRPGLKCAFLHGEGANLHLHIQVHPNTIKL